MTTLFALALALRSAASVSHAPSGPGGAPSLGSASPTPIAAGSPDPVARWIRELGAVGYGSYSLARAMSDFAGVRETAGGLPPSLRAENAGKTIDVCFHPYRPLPGCGFHIVVAASDLPLPPAEVARAPASAGRSAFPLGLTYPQLLARFHADENLASKNVVRGRGGDVAFVTALDEDPPPARYDHGPQSYVRQEYFFRGGVVAAYAYQETEN
jgi:hypothetical protein